MCGGGRAELRQSHVYVSDSNNLQIVQMSSPATDDDPMHYLLRIEGRETFMLFRPDNFTYT